MITKYCEVCGKEFKVYPVRKKQRYCSKKCKGKIMSLNQIGENNPAWKGGMNKHICKICNKVFYRYNNGKSYNNNYCSGTCAGIALSGENNPAWKGGKIERKCVHCGKTFFIYKYQVERGYAKFCSKICHKMGNIKEINPLWKGGSVASRKRTDLRLGTDSKYRLGKLMGNSISQALRKNGGSKRGKHWEDLVGYKLVDLQKRLQLTMPEGYTWQDFLDGKLHIDHIIPVSVFNFSSHKHLDFKRCWALENLQLLQAKENITKNNRIETAFQPSLKL